MAANKSQQLGPRIVIMVRMAIFVAPRRTMRRWQSSGLASSSECPAPCLVQRLRDGTQTCLLGRVKSLDGEESSN